MPGMRALPGIKTHKATKRYHSRQRGTDLWRLGFVSHPARAVRADTARYQLFGGVLFFFFGTLSRTGRILISLRRPDAFAVQKLLALGLVVRVG